VVNAVLVVIALTFQERFDYPAAALYRDPNAVAKQPFVIGWFSTIGLLAWAAVAACALLAGTFVRRLGGGALGLLCLGALTAFLCLDDALMLHEENGMFGHLGLPETPLYAFYAALLLFGLARWREEDPGGALATPVLAILCLGVSLGADQLADLGIKTSAVFEDTAKTLGLSYWAIFLIGFVWRRLASLEASGAVGSASAYASGNQLAVAGRAGVERLKKDRTPIRSW
jgi:hypothetical protein